MTPHIPDNEYYIAGYINSSLEWVNGPAFNTTEDRYRNYLCLTKVENASGGALHIKLRGLNRDGICDAEVSGQVPGPDTDSDPPAHPSEPEGYVHGLYLFLSATTQTVEVSWSQDGETWYPQNMKCLAIGGYQRLIRISGSGIDSATQARALYLTQSGTSQVFARNWLPLNPVGSHVNTRRVLLDNGDWHDVPPNAVEGANPNERKPIPIPAGVNSLVVLTPDPESGAWPPATEGVPFVIIRTWVDEESSVHTTIRPVSASGPTPQILMSTPYAVEATKRTTENPEQPEVHEVRVGLAANVPPIRVWRLGDDRDAAPYLWPGQTLTFEFDDSMDRWELHWDSAGDPKIIVKHPCPPTQVTPS